MGVWRYAPTLIVGLGTFIGQGCIAIRLYSAMLWLTAIALMGYDMPDCLV